MACLAPMPKYVLPDASDATLDTSFGIRSRPPDGKDCKVKVRLSNGSSFETKLHHLLLDPLITDCSMKQSGNAGRAFLRWLAERNIRLHFIASSTLLRAIQTAHHMFVEPCQNGGETCDVLVGNLTVSPLPYVAERSASRQPLQADNLPAPLSMQKDVLRSLYSHDIMDDRFVRRWPRLAQQYQEFKAFLALVLVPALLSPRRSTPGAREALEGAEPGLFAAGDFRVLQLPGGAYRVGPHFDRATYDATEAPELNVALVGHGAMMVAYLTVNMHYCSDVVLHLEQTATTATAILNLLPLSVARSSTQYRHHGPSIPPEAQSPPLLTPALVTDGQ
ncbi:unnamed protein product [Symbiodinium sp. CCMP2592]|nr:unnamed protein product [Symbiodinium sp. CCMP2592]